MDNNAFLTWLSSSSGAGWVFGIVSVIALIASFINRKKPSKIIFKEIYKTSLVRADRKIKNKITIFFEDAVVEDVSQLDVEILNDGTDVIKSPKIFVKFPKETIILSYYFDMPSDNYHAEKEANDRDTLSFTLPYLNSYRQHKESIKLHITLTGDIEDIQVTGSGEGWTVSHITTNDIDNIRKTVLLRIVFAMGLIGIIGMVFLIIFKSIFNIDYTDFSLIAFAVNIPYLVIILVLIYWAIKPGMGSIFNIDNFKYSAKKFFRKQ